MESRQLSSYEVARLARIAENNEVLQQLGVSSTANAIRSDAQENKRQKRPNRKKKKTPEDLVPTRFSARSEGLKRKNYNQTTTNFDFFHGDVENVVKAETMYGRVDGCVKRSPSKRLNLAPRDFSLPDTWKIYKTKRKGGATRGRHDRYYQPPGNEKIWLRSLAEVYRWINEHPEASEPGAGTSSSSSSPIKRKKQKMTKK
jgi:hypothetical protein